MEIFRSDGQNCEDINECLEYSCSHDCENVVGSFKCSCPSGLQLEKDGRHCVVIEECRSCPQSCQEFEGGFK